MSEAALHAAIARVAAGAAAGVLQPLPLVAHSLSAVQAALRQMSQARHVGKVVVRAPALAAQPASSSSSCGEVMVTGGLGTLGTQVAAWLAQQQARQLTLLGRSGRAVDGTDSLALAQPGSAAFAAAVALAMCDAASGENAAGLAAGSGRPLAGLVHAGGVLADGVLGSQTLASLRTVYAPKVDAAAQLGARALAAQPGAFELLFSSVAALLGSPGQANYSAANSWLDAAAQRAQQAGGVAASVQWGAWAGAGMAANDASTAARVARTGMALLAPSQGLAVLEALLVPAQQSRAAAPAPAVLAATPFVWDTLMQRFAGEHPPAFFSEFALEAAAASGSTASGSSNSRGRSARGKPAVVSGVSAADRKAAVLAQVQDAARGILGADVGPEEPLMAAGLDSLGAGALCHAN